MTILSGPAGIRTRATARRLALAAVMSLAVAASAWAQAGPPQVTVAKPLASRVAQWDEFTGRFEATARVEVRARVSGFIDKVHFHDGSIVKAGRPAVHHRPAAVPDRGRFGAVRRGAHQGAGDAGRSADYERAPAAGEDSRRHRCANSTSARPTSTSRGRSSDGGRGGAAHGRAQPRMDRGARADRRPHLRPPRRCRQPDHRRPERRHAADHDRQPRSDPLRVRRLGGRLHPLHAGSASTGSAARRAMRPIR